MITRDQERAALKQITAIMDAIGEESYISIALEGCLEDARENIENDVACSMKDRWECAEQKANKLAEELKRIAVLEKENANLKQSLEYEQEWLPYEDKHNVKQSAYAELAKGAETENNSSRYMTDTEAIELVCAEFGFDPSKVTIVHEISEEEINRHRQCRKTGNKIDRRPVYCASDYYYVRFDACHNHYEAWNEELCPFYC